MSDEKDFSPLLHQVAGCHSGVPSNILINKKGQILKPYKPFSNPTYKENATEEENNVEGADLIPVTLNELQFYSKIVDSSEKDLVSLKKISPKFFGSIMVNDTDHLILEDFTQGMKYPCVMDIKLGRERHYPGRAKDKAKQDGIKYPCLREFGFCIAGIKLWDGETGETDFHLMPQTTRQFSSDQVKEHITKFLRLEKGSNLKEEIIKGIEEIYNWSEEQSSFILRGSSLLIVYDAAGIPTDETNTKIGMIDFAHVFHSYGKQDENYVYGVKNLMEFLKSC